MRNGDSGWMGAVPRVLACIVLTTSATATCFVLHSNITCCAQSSSTTCTSTSGGTYKCVTTKVGGDGPWTYKDVKLVAAGEQGQKLTPVTRGSCVLSVMSCGPHNSCTGPTTMSVTCQEPALSGVCTGTGG